MPDGDQERTTNGPCPGYRLYYFAGCERIGAAEKARRGAFCQQTRFAGRSILHGVVRPGRALVNRRRKTKYTIGQKMYEIPFHRQDDRLIILISKKRGGTVPPQRKLHYKHNLECYTFEISSKTSASNWRFRACSFDTVALISSN